MSELDAALSAASKLSVVRASANVAEARLQGSTQGSTMVPDTSISMVSEATNVRGAAGSSSGAGVIVTGNSPGVGDAAANGWLAPR